jgi:hypothetical protein
MTTAGGWRRQTSRGEQVVRLAGARTIARARAKSASMQAPPRLCPASEARSGSVNRTGFALSWRAALAALAAVMAFAPAAARDPGKPGLMRTAQRAEPRLTVAPTIVAEPASQMALAIQVGPPDALPANSFVRLRGLPPSVSLSEGHAIGPGTWAVPLFSLPTLKANVPAGVSGRSEFMVQLVGVDGALLAEARVSLVVGPPVSTGDRAAPSTAVLPPSPVPAGRPDRNGHAPRPPELSAEERSRAEKLVVQGDRYLESGNIAVARQFYQRAADGGLALGAIKLAATFDPAELVRLKVQGVVPAPAEARKWYERARELGAPEAEERLARLGR